MNKNKSRKKLEPKFGCFFGFLFLHLFSCFYSQIYFDSTKVKIHDSQNIIYVKTEENQKSSKGIIYVSEGARIFTESRTHHYVVHYQKIKKVTPKAVLKKILKSVNKVRSKIKVDKKSIADFDIKKTKDKIFKCETYFSDGLVNSYQYIPKIIITGKYYILHALIYGFLKDYSLHFSGYDQQNTKQASFIRPPPILYRP